MTLAAFRPVLDADFIRYDDTLYVTHNPGVTQGLGAAGLRYAATAIVSGNYHPLTVLSHQLDVTLFALNPRWHHAVNLLFHVVNACLLFHLLTVMTGSPWRSFFVAALFAVHPLHVESVAWISERKDVLSTFFMFLAIGAYLKFTRGRGWTAYARTLVWYALALLAKPMPVTLPFLLLLLDYWPLRRCGDRLRDYTRALPRLAVEKLPLFALSAASCVTTYVVQRKSGAVRGFEAVSLAQRTANAVVSYFAYLRKAVLPTDLAPHYPLAEIPGVMTAVCAGLFVGVAIASFMIARRKPYFFTGWFWYVGALAPVIGIVQVGNQALADRYMYTPMIGVSIAAVWTAAALLEQKPVACRAGVVVAAIGVLACCAMTYRQAQYWRDSRTLFTRTLAISPRSGVAHKVLGIVEGRDGNYSGALDHFRRAYELSPMDRDIAYNLGTALLIVDRVDEAIPLLSVATTVYERPADAYSNLGRAFLQKNRLNEAREQFAKALEINPAQIEARINLGIVEGMLGNTQRAVDLLAEVVRAAPDNADARYSYGLALLKTGQPGDAIPQFEEALRIRPNFAEAASFLAEARAAIQ